MNWSSISLDSETCFYYLISSSINRPQPTEISAPSPWSISLIARAWIDHSVHVVSWHFHRLPGKEKSRCSTLYCQNFSFAVIVVFLLLKWISGGQRRDCEGDLRGTEARCGAFRSSNEEDGHPGRRQGRRWVASLILSGSLKVGWKCVVLASPGIKESASHKLISKPVSPQ